MSQASVLELPAPQTRTVRNATESFTRAAKFTDLNTDGSDALSTGIDLKKGSPVMENPQRVNGCDVFPFVNGFPFRFAGVLKADLPYNKIGDQSSKAVVEGVVRVNVRVVTAANATINSPVYPYGCDSDGYVYFAAGAAAAGVATSFRLLEDLTGRSDSTNYKVEDGQGALIEILPGAALGDAVSSIPAAANATYYDENHSALDSAATTVTLEKQFPDIPRNVTVRGDGANSSAIACTVTGYNACGEVITETINAATDTSTVAGAKAFARVTSIAVAQADATTALDFGYGVVQQMPRCSGGKPYLVEARAGNTPESTAPTIANDQDDIESNTIDFDTAADGSTVLTARFLY